MLETEVEYDFCRLSNSQARLKNVHIVCGNKLLCTPDLALETYNLEYFRTVDSRAGAIIKAADIQINHSDICGICVGKLYADYENP